jgi:hypothetical protein
MVVPLALVCVDFGDFHQHQVRIVSLIAMVPDSEWRIPILTVSFVAARSPWRYWHEPEQPDRSDDVRYALAGIETDHGSVIAGSLSIRRASPRPPKSAGTENEGALLPGPGLPLARLESWETIKSRRSEIQKPNKLPMIKEQKP